MLKIGSHVSNSGEEMLLLSLKEALNYHENCFMVYLGPPQNTMRKDYSLLHAEEFRKKLIENNINISDVIVHAPYIVNFSQCDIEKRNFAISFITKELMTLSKIGAKYMVIHPGAHLNQGIDKGIELISDSLKKILDNTKGDDTCLLIETMAGKGSECCFRFEQIAQILKNVNSPRLKVCFDTCHTHDSGYDLVNNYEGVIEEFDKTIGIENICAFHINDSLNECGSKKDRHANIGFGKIGFETLMKFIYDKRFENIPKILETPFVKNGDESFPPYKYEIEMIRNNKFDENLLEKIVKGE